MTKSKATKLAKIINYFANEWPNNVWEAELHTYYEKEYKVIVKLNNSAYRHELNALMMVINNNVTSSVYQEVDDEGEIIWKVW